jgi:hypothetical protein
MLNEKAFEGCDKNAQEQEVLMYSLIYIGFGLCGLIVQSLQVCALLISVVIFHMFFILRFICLLVPVKP